MAYTNLSEEVNEERAPRTSTDLISSSARILDLIEWFSNVAPCGTVSNPDNVSTCHSTRTLATLPHTIISSLITVQNNTATQPTTLSLHSHRL